MVRSEISCTHEVNRICDELATLMEFQVEISICLFGMLYYYLYLIICYVGKRDICVSTLRVLDGCYSPIDLCDCKLS